MTAPERLEAIVIGRQDYRESDRIVRLLTPQRGRVDALVRGARSPRHKHSGLFEVGNLMEIHLKRGRGTLDFIEEADLIDARLHIRENIDTIAYAVFACEVCSLNARPDHAEPRLYGLLNVALAVLDALSHAPASAFEAGIATKAAAFCGLRPHLTTCRVCGEPGDGPLRWSPVDGGMAHARCDATGEAVELPWLQAVEHALHTPLRDLVDLPLPPGPTDSLTHALEDAGGRPLQTRSMLAHLAPSP